MNAFSRCLSVVMLALGLGLATCAGVQAAPVCVSRDEVGMAGAAGLQSPGGMGGTGVRSASGGVGGTGAPAQQRPGGTGGTGAVADGVDGILFDRDNGGVGGTGAPVLRPGGTGGTGIVGTITGFASICVNGLEVHFGKDVPVSENGMPASSAHLAIGQVVAIEAFVTQRGLNAGRISILNVYEGPLTALPNAAGPLRVMGQPVRLAAGARVAEGLRPGEPVKVSGLRDANGAVVASRIERAPGLKASSAIGTIDRAGSLQGLKLGTRMAPAQEVLVRGQWTGRQLEVVQSRPDPSLPFAGRVQTAVIEGLVQHRQNQRLVVGGIQVTLGRDTVIVGEQAQTLAVDQRVRVSGVFTGHRELRAARVESPGERLDHSGKGNRERSTDQNSNSTTGSRNSGHGGGDTRAFKDDHSGKSVRVEVGADDHGATESVDHAGSERVEAAQKQESHGNSGRPERVERAEAVEKAEKVEKIEKGEKVEKPDKVEKVEKVEKIDKVDKVEKVERVEKIEKVEKVEKIEKVEKVEKVEKTEKVERPERSGH